MKNQNISGDRRYSQHNVGFYQICQEIKHSSLFVEFHSSTNIADIFLKYDILPTPKKNMNL